MNTAIVGLLALILGAAENPNQAPLDPDLTVKCPNKRVVDLYARDGDKCELLYDSAGVVVGGECRQQDSDAERSTAMDCALGCAVSVYPADCTER